jgi:hypothetical protein
VADTKPLWPPSPSGPLTSVSPPVATVGQTAADESAGGDAAKAVATPDVFGSWRVFARAIGVHYPTGINQARITGAQIRRMAR